MARTWPAEPLTARPTTLSSDAGRELCRAMGLPPNLIGFELKATLGQPVRVIAQYYATADQLDRVVQVIRQYELAAREGSSV